MSDLRLPGLLPDDPKNLLSYASRQRIAKAHMVAERIRTEALSTLQTRYRAEHHAGVSFAEYLRRGSAFVELTESDMKAARTVLGTEAEEYRKLGLPDSRYSEIMRGQIEGAVNSLELSRLQNQMLELEFVWGASGHVDDEGRPAERCEKNISAADRVRTFMDRKGLTIHAIRGDVWYQRQNSGIRFGWSSGREANTSGGCERAREYPRRTLPRMTFPLDLPIFCRFA